MFLSPCYERCTSPRTSLFFFFNDTATTEIYTLSLHDALPICDRLSRALRAIAQWCRQHRHAPISWQHAVLSRKLRGHYSYYGITGNSVAITRFRHEVRSRWRKWLNRRGGRSYMSWPQFHRLEERYLLPA